MRIWNRKKPKDSLKRDISILGELERVYDLLASAKIISPEVHDDLKEFVMKKRRTWSSKLWRE